MGTSIRVLLVEDSEDDAALLVRALRRGGYEPNHLRVETPEAMRSALENGEWDAIIADYVMPHFSGLAALRLARERQIDIPFIVVSGKMGEDTAVEAMRAGAHDYVTKENLARLVPAIERELRDAAGRRERKRLEEQLLRVQRLELIGRTAGQVAHDLNNLLTPLIGYPQLMKRLLPPDHPTIKLCDAMIERVRQMTAINEDLLTLGRRGRIALEPTDLNRVVEQAAAQMPEQPATIALHLDLAPDLQSILGAPAQLLRVITNLLSNALDATQEAGLVVVRTRNVREELPFGRYNRIEPGEFVQVSVSDTGCGIPPEVVDKIFDPFFTTKTPDRRHGSGLGLSIVQAIVEDHQGHIDLESEVGQGTTFSVYIPMHRGTLEASKQPTARGPADSGLATTVKGDAR